MKVLLKTLCVTICCLTPLLATPKIPNPNVSFAISNVNGVSNDYAVTPVVIRAGERNTLDLYVTTNTAGGGTELVRSGMRLIVKITVNNEDESLEGQMTVSGAGGKMRVSLTPLEFFTGVARLEFYEQVNKRVNGRYQQVEEYLGAKAIELEKPAIKKIVLEGLPQDENNAQAYTINQFQLAALRFYGINTLNQLVPLNAGDIEHLKLKVETSLSKLIWVAENTNKEPLSDLAIDMVSQLDLLATWDQNGAPADIVDPASGMVIEQSAIGQAVANLLNQNRMKYLTTDQMTINVIVRAQMIKETNILRKGTHIVRLHDIANEMKLMPASCGRITLSIIEARGMEGAVTRATYTINVAGDCSASTAGVDGETPVCAEPDAIRVCDESETRVTGPFYSVAIPLNGKASDDVLTRVLNSEDMKAKAEALNAENTDASRVLVAIPLDRKGESYIYGYIIKKDDTLSELADLFWGAGGKWRTFLDYNEIHLYTPRAEPDKKAFHLLRIGEELNVPIPDEQVIGEVQ